jgi:hypothetical protein
MESRVVLDAGTPIPSLAQLATNPVKLAQATQAQAQQFIDGAGQQPAARLLRDVAVGVVAGAAGDAAVFLAKSAVALGEEGNPAAIVAAGAALDFAAISFGASTAALKDASTSGPAVFNQVVSKVGSALQQAQQATASAVGALVQAVQQTNQATSPPPSQLTPEQQLQLLNQILLGPNQTPTPTPTPGTDPSDNDFDSDTVDTGTFVPDDVADANGTS